MARFYGLRGHKLNRLMLFTVVGPAFLLLGYNNACAGGLLNLPDWVETFPQINTVTTTGRRAAHNSTIQGTAVASYTLGCFMGALSCIFVGNKIGRIRTIALACVVHIIGATVQSSAYSLAHLIVGRIVLGMGYGGLSATTPMWQAECSVSEHRGKNVVSEGTFASLGLVVVAWLEFGLSFTTGSVTWRLPIALAALPTIIILSFVLRMPESPRWLLMQGRIEEAHQVVAALNDLGVESSLVAAKVTSIRDKLDVGGVGGFRNFFLPQSRQLRHRMSIAVASLAFLQLCGVNAISFYIGPIFELDLGLSGRIASILGASVFTWQTLCSLIAVYTIDRLGRRKLMLFSAIGMGCCMAIAAGTASYPDNRAAIIVAGICLFMFSFFFPIGFLGLPFLYSAEVAPVRARVLITAISTSTTWILNFMIAEVTPIGFSHIHARYFVIYACMNFGLILPTVYFFFPETGGRSLEEIDELFAASTVFNVVKNSKVSGGGVDVPLEQQPERIGKVSEEMVETRNDL